MRYGQWHRDKNAPNVRNVPRLIVFIMGGMTYSEMRCAYEVTKDRGNWEVYIGKAVIDLCQHVNQSSMMIVCLQELITF